MSAMIKLFLGPLKKWRILTSCKKLQNQQGEHGLG